MMKRYDPAVHQAAEHLMREQFAMQMNNMERGMVKEVVDKGYFLIISFLVGYMIWSNVLKPDLKEMCALLVEAIQRIGVN